MDLKEFVSQSLKDIVDGIEDAREHAKSNNLDFVTHYKPINFDVAVTTNDLEEKKKEGGLNKIIVAGISKNSEKFNSTVSRIQFTILFDR